MRPLILVEPIMRGSRLHILSYVMQALHQQRTVILLTRPDYNTEHFQDELGDLLNAFDIRTTSVDIDGEWFRHLTVSEFLSYIWAVHQIAKDYDEGVDVVFMAMDEYIVPFMLAGVARFALTKIEKVYTFRYRVDYWILGAPSIWKQAIKWVTNTALYGWDADVLVFDERITDVRDQVPTTVHVVCDPWSGTFSPDRRETARERYNLEEKKIRLLTLGKQSPRKGIGFLTSAMHKVLSDLEMREWLVAGHIAAPFQDDFNNLKRSLPGSTITHRDEFIPEPELPDLFASSDIVLLPYHPSFTASSGVLARAAASGVPVVATDHGLVGHRVEAWEMGETFPAGDADAFQTAIQTVLNSSESYTEGLKAFADTCTTKKFSESIKKIIK